MAESDFEGVETKAGGDVAESGFDPRHEHPEYSAQKEAWKTTRDFYQGADAVVPKLKVYMPQRRVGEDEGSYEERLALAHVAPLLGIMVDGLIGLFSAKEPEEEDWGDLGAVGEDGELMPDSKAALIVRNADGSGANWSNFRRELATWLVVYKRLHVYVTTNKPTGVEGTAADNYQPVAILVSPLDHPDWIRSDGRKVDAVIREEADTRESLDGGEYKAEPRFLRLQLGGWSRYALRGEGEQAKAVRIEGDGYEFTDPATGRPAIPLVEAELPMPRYACYSLARIVLAILNHDSYLDTVVRAGTLGQYLTVQGDEEEVRKNVVVGEKVLPYGKGFNPPAFVGYDMSAAQPAAERIADLVERFWQTAMYEFSDKPAERTATQIEYEWAAGIGAFLTILAGAVEEAENNVRALMAQAAGVSDGGYVKLPVSFRVEDVIAEMQRLKDLVFGIGGELTMSPALEQAVTKHILTRIDKQSGVLSELPEDVDVDAELEDATAQKELARSRMEGLVEEAEATGDEEEEVAEAA